jgi:5-methylcytosine-specific restriction enzyme subunit McrC
VQVLTLKEYVPLELDRHELSDEHAALLHARAAGRLTVEAPGPATGGKWRLTPGGWVGHWPITDDLALSLQPRVGLSNIFRMLEYAYDLKSFELFDGVHECSSLQDMYERLAMILAKRVLDRSRRGFYRNYVALDERLAHVRGRIDLPQTMRRPWEPQLPCHFQEHTADIEDNAILTQTLSVIARSGMCTAHSAPTVRRAYRALAGLAPSRGLSTADCLGRLYHRLNQDYQPMHALCRFFLEHSGPTHQTGDHDMIPFVVHMPMLFEKFVAEWLRVHLPPELALHAQYAMAMGDDGALSIKIDLLLRDAEGRAVCVLDTKYKIAEQPKLSDCEQVVAYAVANNCYQAILIYPAKMDRGIDLLWGGVRLRTLSFDLAEELDLTGTWLVNGICDGFPGSRVSLGNCDDGRHIRADSTRPA